MYAEEEGRSGQKRRYIVLVTSFFSYKVDSESQNWLFSPYILYGWHLSKKWHKKTLCHQLVACVDLVNIEYLAKQKKLRLALLNMFPVLIIL